MNVIEEYPIHEKKDTAYIIIATAIIWDMHRNRKIIEKQWNIATLFIHVW